MAERYEPKVAVRPLSERKPAPPASGEADPLFELTRMVTGRSTFDPPPSSKNKTVPAAGPTVASNAALANDLESELMNDLQASFAMVREPPPAPPPAPAPKPAPVAARPTPAPGPRPQAPVAPPITSESAPRAERITAPPRTPAPPAPVAPARAERAPQPAQPQTLADKPSFFRSGSGPTVDLSHIQMRPTTPAAPAHAPEAPPVRASSSRWDAPDEDKAANEAPSRFAPPRASAAGFRPEPEAVEGFDDGLAAEDAYPEDFALEDMAPLPEYAEGEEELPPFPEDELAGLSRRRTNRALIIAGAVLVVAIAGGLGYAMLGDTGSTGTPPIITADATPTKVPPAEPAASTEIVKESYDRVDAADNTGDAKLVTPSDGQIAALPAEENANNAISRVIVPAGPGFDAPIADNSGTPAADASDATDASSIGPKKVRTVVVRPDGTIVSSEAAPADGAAPADASAPADAAATEATPAPVETAEAPPSTTAGSDMDKVIDGNTGDIPVNPDPLNSDAAAAEPAASADSATAAEPEAGTVPAGDAAPEASGDAAPADAADVAVADTPPPPEPAAKPAKPSKPVVVAAKGPMSLTPTTPKAASGSGVLVQLSSQKSEDAARAAYGGLRKRFPGILGPYDPNIVRADLGDRGIYYRVRVGPFSGADATRLCEDLKAAGGDCIIAR